MVIQCSEARMVPGTSPHYARIASAVRLVFCNFLENSNRQERSRALAKFIGFSIPLLLSILSSFVLVFSLNEDPVENVPYSDFESMFDSNHLKLSQGSSVEYVLHEQYQIPEGVLAILSHSNKHQLLTVLQTQSEPSVMVSRIVGSNTTKRFAAVASSLSYARLTKRILIVIWDGEHRRGKQSPPLLLKQSSSSPVFLSSTASNVDSIYTDNYHWITRNFADHHHRPSNLPPFHDRSHLFVNVSDAMSGPYVQLFSGIEQLSSSFLPSSDLKNSFDEYVNPLTSPHLSSSELSDRLHRLFSVPRVFLAEMSDTNQRRLLYQLDRSKSKRVFFLHAQFGLGNRLRALGSAMAVANVSGFALVLIWVPDVHLNCDFDDLFANDMVVMSRFSLEWPPSAIHSSDRALSSVDFYNFMRHEGNKQVHNPAKVYVNPRIGRHVYVKTAYVVQSKYTPRIISYSSAYWNTMRRSLVPVPDVMSIVEQPDLQNIRSLIGVHIRSRRIKDDIKGVGQEFYGKGSVTTDFWRNRTNAGTFAKKIGSLPKTYRYFVAADVPEVTEFLKSKFGSHRFYSVSNELRCVSRSVLCAKLALADIILLSRTRVLLGSHWSSFSEAAVRMSGRMKVHLAGLHFT